MEIVRLANAGEWTTSGDVSVVVAGTRRGVPIDSIPCFDDSVTRHANRYLERTNGLPP